MVSYSTRRRKVGEFTQAKLFAITIASMERLETDGRKSRVSLTLLVLDLLLNSLDVIRLLNIKGNGLAREGLHEDLHGDSSARYD